MRARAGCVAGLTCVCVCVCVCVYVCVCVAEGWVGWGGGGACHILTEIKSLFALCLL